MQYSKTHNLFLLQDVFSNIICLKPKKNGGFTRLKKVKPTLDGKGIDKFADQFFIEDIDALVAFRGDRIYFSKLMTQRIYFEK